MKKMEQIQGAKMNSFITYKVDTKRKQRHFVCPELQLWYFYCCKEISKQKSRKTEIKILEKNMQNICMQNTIRSKITYIHVHRLYIQLENYALSLQMEKLTQCNKLIYSRIDSLSVENSEFKSSFTVPYCLLNQIFCIDMSTQLGEWIWKPDCLVLNSNLTTFELWGPLPHCVSMLSSIKWQ